MGVTLKKLKKFIVRVSLLIGIFILFKTMFNNMIIFKAIPKWLPLVSNKTWLVLILHNTNKGKPKWKKQQYLT